ncbi:SAM-dependent methyltransferase (plasmid) [Streptosporangium sp. NBC_01495]|uniref:SAM-dependent methyltransferase n=1 Tax=Streptosporangium sp. NBC_01495 TaxID=2903899 RepID=UPI002E34A399|nr:SAM-dependent methyltransferase [Streptosporangium sp. NBC_01495]
MSESEAPAVLYRQPAPNVARMYDYLLDGKDNYAVDQEAADRLIKLVPDLRNQVRNNREFLRRGVEALAQRGVRRFLDLGSGLPTQENVHQVVHRIAPEAQVVYVDMDRVAATHGHALLASNDGLVRMVEADVRETAALLQHPDVAALRPSTEPAEPIAVSAVALLHFMPEPQRILDSFREWLPVGSYLMLSHATPGTMSSEAVQEALEVYERAGMRMYLRSPEEIADLFAGFELLDEGVAPVSRWGLTEVVVPTPTPTGGHFLGGIAVLRHR